jgi:hypothetical protein
MASRKRQSGAEATSFLRNLVSNYSLSLTLAALFLVSWVAQFVFEWIHFRDEAQEHGSSFQFWEFFPGFWQSTLENWQSEFLQLFAFVTLTAFLIHRGSPESKDGDEEMQAKLDAIQEELKELRRVRT